MVDGMHPFVETGVLGKHSFCIMLVTDVVLLSALSTPPGDKYSVQGDDMVSTTAYR